MAIGLGIAGCSPVESPPEFVSQNPVEIADEAVSSGTVSGIVLATIENGEVHILHAAGVADIETGRRLTTSTPINVASISKSVTAIGVLAFAQDNDMDLDQAVWSLITRTNSADLGLDETRNNFSSLLSHTGGLIGASVPVTPINEPLPDLYRILKYGEGGVDPVEQGSPGEFRYSGMGYLLLQMAIEDQAGVAFGDYMEDRVLALAGMESSSFRPRDLGAENLATYVRSNGSKRSSYHLPGAAGGLYSTAEDMADWLLFYSRLGSGEGKILTASSFTELFEPRASEVMPSRGNGTVGYSLGHYLWQPDSEHRFLFHTGGNPGLRSFFLVSPEDGDGIFVAANHDDGNVAINAIVGAWAKNKELPLPPMVGG